MPFRDIDPYDSTTPDERWEDFLKWHEETLGTPFNVFREDYRPSQRRIGATTIKRHGVEYYISTVDLGMDMRSRLDDGPPLYYETMVFADHEDIYCERYSTFK